MSSSTISPNALSLYFSSDQPTPITIDQLLTLPPLLEPISPALASLHLARIRLLLSIPPGVLDQTAWCRTCGGLREVRASTSLSDASGSGSGTITISPEIKSPRKGKGKAKAKTKSPIKRRAPMAKECAKCGTSFKRPKVIDEAKAFPPARTVRAVRTRNQSQADSLLPPIPTSATNPTIPTEQAFEPMIATARADQAIPPVSSTTMPLPPTITPDLPSPPSPPPKYVYNHGLIHVHTSSPNLPTYPQPPAVHASPPPKEKSKKRKKSGLARLLAENKERESGGASAGSGSGWGLE
jgi:hypothetical protein